MDLPEAAAISAQLQRLGLGIAAAELHGAACGWIAGGGEREGNWLAAVMVDPDLAPVAMESALDALFRASVRQFEDRDFSLGLLLADDEASLGERSASLFDWCRGFLGGFGLAAGAEPALSDEGREALADLARLAAASAQEEGDEDDEQALVEIEEFVRVAAMLLHGDCVLAARHRRALH
ncbi:MAG: UPF0149 family protein [Pseudoxanthomonas suwonensis]|nr:UPF0149 family protein [Pseudoxanthomonas suwonensis]